MTQAVILAGGKGTRLAVRLGGLPKALIDVGGNPLLERQIEHLAGFGVTDILLLVNHGAAAIAEFVQKMNRAGVRIRLVDDGEPRGTAGAVLAALDHLAERFIVVYGDTLINVDLEAFLGAHARARADATLFLHPNDHPQDFDIVEAGDDGWVRAMHPYPHIAGQNLPNCVNAALYVVEKRALQPFRDIRPPFDFGKDVFPAMLASHAKILGYSSFEYVKDLGTPERLSKVERDLRNGVVDRARLSVPQKAVFVDRDGTLNVHRGFITQPAQLDLLPGVANGIRRLNENEFRVIVVTNQPVLARGEATTAQLREIHNRLETILGQQGAFLDAIYYCPHHPDGGFSGEIASLKIACDCRKPMTGLVDRAARAMNIDMDRSWMVGDSVRDIEMAERAHLRSILVTTGDSDSDVPARPNFIRNSFSAAVDTILGTPERGI